jgi:hypothetical protein
MDALHFGYGRIWHDTTTWHSKPYNLVIATHEIVSPIIGASMEINERWGLIYLWQRIEDRRWKIEKTKDKEQNIEMFIDRFVGAGEKLGTIIG